jgi:tRNA pseudouridine38-40 synthase
VKNLPERQIRLVVEYDGSAFNGWQAGPRAPGGGEGRSVQEALEAAVEAVTGERATVVGAGRTDAGVSALGQVACFLTKSAIPADRFAPALTAKLPRDVAVLSSDEVPPDFHPRKSAKMKLYRYRVSTRAIRPAVGRGHVMHFGAELDVAAMREGAEALVGTHDFTSFAAAEATRTKNPERTITRLDVSREGGVVTFEVEGPAFLMHMVRTIVGSLLEVGRGKEASGWIAQALAARDRSSAGPTAPPDGLTLVWVRYDAQPATPGR